MEREKTERREGRDRRKEQRRQHCLKQNAARTALGVTGTGDFSDATWHVFLWFFSLLFHVVVSFWPAFPMTWGLATCSFRFYFLITSETKFQALVEKNLFFLVPTLGSCAHCGQDLISCSHSQSVAWPREGSRKEENATMSRRKEGCCINATNNVHPSYSTYNVYQIWRHL